MAHPHAQTPIPLASLISQLPFLLPAFPVLHWLPAPSLSVSQPCYSSLAVLSRAQMCTGSLCCRTKCVMSWWRRWNTTASGQEAGMR